MKYTVKELAKLSGVSVRTLHFYDEIDLLKPAEVGENGYRRYGRDELLRLQQILFYRELGFRLSDIAELLSASDFDLVKALEGHRKALEANLDHTRELLDTLDRTLVMLKGKNKMKDHELYQGFAPEKQAEYEQELVERYGEKAKSTIAESQQRMKGWGKADFERVKNENHALNEAFASCMERGVRVEAEEVQQIVAKHYEWLHHFYTPNFEMYRGLGALYAEHPDFRKLYDGYRLNLADYMAQAIGYFADQAQSKS